MIALLLLAAFLAAGALACIWLAVILEESQDQGIERAHFMREEWSDE
jgi:hypothetical protein